MTFSFQVAGHAGPDVRATDDDEGERVQRLALVILEAGIREGLNITVQSFSPRQWAPETRTAWAMPGRLAR